MTRRFNNQDRQTGNFLATPVPNVGTVAGTGFFVPYTIFYPQSTVSAALVTSGNQIVAIMFVLPFAITVRKVSVAVNIAAAASTIALGIYSADGNTKLVDSGPISSATTGIKTVTLATSVTLQPGTYFFVQTASSTTVTTDNLGAQNNRTSMLNQNANRAGSAANTAPGSVLPATLGAITPSGFGVTLGFFEA